MSWFKTPDTLFEEKKQSKKNTIISTYKTYAKEPVAANNLVWSGGDTSASAIKGAIELAQQNGEATVSLWDFNDILHENISFDDALSIALAIALQYRNRMVERSMKIDKVDNATTQTDLDAITLPEIQGDD